MAAVPLHISNMREAIAKQEIPGSFTEDRKKFIFKTLEYSDAKGATHTWTISVSLLDSNNDYVSITDEFLDTPQLEKNGYKAEIVVESLQIKGKVRDIVPTYVSSGKNIGKKNATNCISQAIREALARHNKQSKRVLSTSGVDINILLPPPMLARKSGDSIESTLTPAMFENGVTIQRKLNGVHLVACIDNDNILLYSRASRKYPGQTHLLTELKSAVKNLPAIQVGKFGIESASIEELQGYARPYFTGELYLHGKSLNWIAGQARKTADENQLQFHIFDVFFPYVIAAGKNMISMYRQQYLDEFFKLFTSSIIIRVENFPAKTSKDIDQLMTRFLSEGYEGAIVRKDYAGYQYSFNNYHSPNVIKIKPVLDNEFPVVGFTQGVNGKEVGALIWICEVPNAVDENDKTFHVLPKNMSYEDRYKLFKCLSEIVDPEKNLTRFEKEVKGKPLTIEFREISPKTGKPLQAKALTFRTYESGSEQDPMHNIFKICGLIEC